MTPSQHHALRLQTSLLNFTIYSVAAGKSQPVFSSGGFATPAVSFDRKRGACLINSVSLCPASTE